MVYCLCSSLVDNPPALPDGTFLIINGTQQGVAGFGLAIDPNLRCSTTRISILNNTIVARLYHSEARVLLLPSSTVVFFPAHCSVIAPP